MAMIEVAQSEYSNGTKVPSTTYWHRSALYHQPVQLGFHLLMHSIWRRTSFIEARCTMGVKIYFHLIPLKTSENFLQNFRIFCEQIRTGSVMVSFRPLLGHNWQNKVSGMIDTLL